jgi:abortive infection alpha-like protein
VGRQLVLRLPDGSDVRRSVGTGAAVTRLAVGLWWRTATWTVSATLTSATDAGSALARAAVSGQPPTELLSGLGFAAQVQARRLLGLNGDAGTGQRSLASSSSGRDENSNGETPHRATPEELRQRATELLRRSADVGYTEEYHPAFARILEELAPDEIRLLRLLGMNGPQPSVDVRNSRPISGNSELIAPGLTMIGAEAGCRYVERIPAYLNNLYRLGLIWFSREAVPDQQRYQVLEAQPDVLDALDRAGRGVTVRRSIHLTPFGAAFCRACLVDPEESAALPAHQIPEE